MTSQQIRDTGAYGFWSRSQWLAGRTEWLTNTSYAQSRILYEINYLGMESSAHDVVIMSGQYGNTASRLPVPDSDGLIIRSWDDPRVLVMKLPGDNNFDVILMTQFISEVFSVTFKHFLYCDTLLRIDMTCDDRKYLELTWTVRM